VQLDYYTHASCSDAAPSYSAHWAEDKCELADAESGRSLKIYQKLTCSESEGTFTAASFTDKDCTSVASLSDMATYNEIFNTTSAPTQSRPLACGTNGAFSQLMDYAEYDSLKITCGHTFDGCVTVSAFDDYDCKGTQWSAHADSLGGCTADGYGDFHAYACNSGTVTLDSYTSSDCSGTKVSSIAQGKSSECTSDGTLFTCGCDTFSEDGLVRGDVVPGPPTAVPQLNSTQLNSEDGLTDAAALPHLLLSFWLALASLARES